MMKKLLSTRKKHNKGFTLVEMSIVLVIIGLIIGGILTGKELIFSAKIKRTVSDIEKYQLAFNAFILKFDEIPGDMTYAASIWPSCPDVVGNNCNGNGDGRITGDEKFRAWQHMALAEIIPGSYTGVYANAVYYAPGGNVPATDLHTRGCYDILTKTISPVLYYKNHTGISLTLGTRGWGHCVGSIMTPSYALGIDMKMDDGHERTGKMFIANGSGHWARCLTGGSYPHYLRKTVTDTVCYIHRWMD